MAKVTYGGGVSAFTGSIGGLTFQSNRSGTIVRRRPSTYKSITSKQSDAIQDMFYFQNLWQNLSEVNIDLWNTFADTWQKKDMWNDGKTLSGLNWFTSINYYRVLTGHAVLNAPPAHTLAIAIPTFTFILKNNAVVLRFETAWGAVADNFLIYTTLPISNKTNSFRSALRLTKVVNDGPFHSLDLTTDWETAHNLTYPPGQSGPNFYIGIALRTSKDASCIMGPASFAITKFDNNPRGIGAMIIGSTYKIG